MSYFPKPSLNENDLAIIERGDTAAHSIEAGQYVSWHGKTGKAKAAILQGATLEDTLFDYSENGAINELNASIITIEQTVTSLHAYGKDTSNYQVFTNLVPNGYTPICVFASDSPHRDVLPIGPACVNGEWSWRLYNYFSTEQWYTGKVTIVCIKTP